MKRAPGLHRTAKNRLVYFLANILLLVEGLPATDASLRHLSR